MIIAEILINTFVFFILHDHIHAIAEELSLIFYSHLFQMIPCFYCVSNSNESESKSDKLSKLVWLNISFDYESLKLLAEKSHCIFLYDFVRMFVSDWSSQTKECPWQLLFWNLHHLVFLSCEGFFLLDMFGFFSGTLTNCSYEIFQKCFRLLIVSFQSNILFFGKTDRWSYYFPRQHCDVQWKFSIL